VVDPLADEGANDGGEHGRAHGDAELAAASFSFLLAMR